MNLYYIRCHPNDWAELIALGNKLGAVTEVETEEGNTIIVATQGGAWDYIGEIHEPTGETVIQEGIEVPVTAPICAADGTPLLHANLITPIALGELTLSLMGSDEELAAAWAQLNKFFLLDEKGEARLPTKPWRVFAQ